MARLSKKSKKAAATALPTFDSTSNTKPDDLLLINRGSTDYHTTVADLSTAVGAQLDYAETLKEINALTGDLSNYAKLSDVDQSIVAKDFTGDGSKLTNLPIPPASIFPINDVLDEGPLADPDQSILFSRDVDVDIPDFGGEYGVDPRPIKKDKKGSARGGLIEDDHMTGHIAGRINANGVTFEINESIDLDGVADDEKDEYIYMLDRSRAKLNAHDLYFSGNLKKQYPSDDGSESVDFSVGAGYDGFYAYFWHRYGSNEENEFRFDKDGLTVETENLSMWSSDGEIYCGDIRSNGVIKTDGLVAKQAVAAQIVLTKNFRTGYAQLKTFEGYRWDQFQSLIDEGVIEDGDVDESYSGMYMGNIGNIQFISKDNVGPDAEEDWKGGLIQGVLRIDFNRDATTSGQAQIYGVSSMYMDQSDDGESTCQIGGVGSIYFADKTPNRSMQIGGVGSIDMDDHDGECQRRIGGVTSLYFEDNADGTESQIQGVKKIYMTDGELNGLKKQFGSYEQFGDITLTGNITANSDDPVDNPFTIKSDFFEGDGSKLTNLPIVEPDLTGALVFKGTVANESALPGDAATGDLYYNEDNDRLYAKGDAEWHQVGSIEDVDLSAYAQLSGAEFTGEVSVAGGAVFKGPSANYMKGALFGQLPGESDGKLDLHQIGGIWMTDNGGGQSLINGLKQINFDTDGGRIINLTNLNLKGDSMITGLKDIWPTDDFKINGDAEVDGDVTATAFVGDGSKLTNLPVADVDLDEYAVLDGEGKAQLINYAKIGVLNPANYIDNNGIYCNTLTAFSVEVGSIDAEHTITANKFVGDGSKLTNLPCPDPDVCGLLPKDISKLPPIPSP